MKKWAKYLICLVIIFIPVFYVGLSYISGKFPDVYHISSGESRSFSVYPFSVVPDGCSEECISTGMSGFEASDDYMATLKFMNIFPVKSVKVHVCEGAKVTPCGVPFGVKLYTKGAVVIGTSSVRSDEGMVEPWSAAGIRKGDVIIAADDKEVLNNDDLEQIIQNSSGSEIEFRVMRENKEFITHLKPLKSTEDDKYRIGIWVRDSSAGIGTLTFCSSKNHIFAGLGHGICDVDTSELLPLSRGEIVGAQITSIVPGCQGVPGQLKGCFTDPKPIGEICVNNETGLYGNLSSDFNFGSEVNVVMKQRVKKGPAQILTTIEGDKPALYDINIDSINYDVTIPTKNMKISVTDPRLLEKTGGIVQGMSGSPILQNGGLIGAVTHVFVNNPARGYAIFAETMLTNSNLFLESRYKNAS